LAASGDVSHIVLQMLDAAVQPMVDPLLQRGIFRFKGGLRGDAHGYVFSPKDFFRKQTKAGGNEKG
jgi:hypothetical protein